MLACRRLGLYDPAGGRDVAVASFYFDFMVQKEYAAINEYAVRPTQTSCRRAGGGT